MICLLIILTVIHFSKLSPFTFEKKRQKKPGLQSQFTTYHLPLVEENDCSKLFLQSAYLKMLMELPAT